MPSPYDVFFRDEAVLELISIPVFPKCGRIPTYRTPPSVIMLILMRYPADFEADTAYLARCLLLRV